ncbi:dihydrofolate reductase [Pontibacter ummariensis]|uniref:Dihydrofolate reductase n=1 Tax=Pontibacter ummariensis TaxID=1610492 RepID=A0A239JS76_9BACT|nr:dihydrofolate reductase family protein [Pontibacter ummariensis]PRY07390.1 dihydrofolate reductase [Pontibacter ummariensis]SNT08298.1 dihydrofolate reductase [Pontibacter ummariensis]
MTPERKVVVYIAMSLDGYIAGPNDDLTFLSTVEKEGEDYGYSAFYKTVDTIILGRKTYDWVMKQVPVFPHSGKESYILTSTARPAIGKTRFYTGDVKELIAKLKSQPGKNIFIDGGAETVTALLQDKLVDEFYISIIPILLGEGIRLFKDGRPAQQLKLVETKPYDTGLVQLHYKRFES